jgi:hypothetical protein
MKPWLSMAAAPLLALALALPAARVSAAAPAAKVSFLEGAAEKEAGGEKSALAVGAPLAEGDSITTDEQGRLEIKFADDSLLRVGSRAKLQLTAAHFGKAVEERKMTAKLFFGQVWAKVTRVFTKEATFQIETENAVAGVRGTTFRVDAKSDKSVLVRVYAGAVAVAKNVPIYATDKPGDARREVAGPDEVSRDQWEHVVGRHMEIAISADGTPSAPAKFDAAAEKDDDWARWNHSRDAAKK